ncbi:MAG: hypothetical protein GY859_14855, partial [Desulfobacterales bacterium]|nr:hypothetical protein [Desulfobacterales bacterium]
MDTMTGVENKVEELTTAYETLTSFEKILVQLCSVILEPVNKTKILKCFQRTGIRIPGVKISRVSELSPYLNRLRDLDLLRDDYRCNKLFVEKATRRAIVAGWKKRTGVNTGGKRLSGFLAMARAVRKELPPPIYNGHDDVQKSRLRLFRDFRVGIYTNDATLWNECYNRYCSLSDARDAGRDPFVRLCMNPFDPEWFSSLPLNTRIMALMKIFQSTLSRLESDEELLSLALDEEFRCAIPETERPGFYTVLISRLLFAGRVKEARRLIPEIADNGYSGGLSAWSFFLQGKNEQAIDSFESDLATLREKAENKNLFFVGMAGLFFILALLKRQVIHDDPDALEKLNHYLGSAMERRYPHPMMEPCYRALDAILHYCQYEKEKAERIISENSQGFEPAADLLTVFAKFWIFGRVDREEIDLISEIFMKSRKIGVDWLGMEAAELLCRVEQQIPIRKNYADRVKRRAGLMTMMEMLRVEAPWQKTLHALIRAASPRPRKMGGASGKRLIWLVSFEEEQVFVQPREQNLTPRKTWTKGHAVALSRLFSGRDLEYLSNKDRLIQASLEKFSSYVGSVEYRFNPEKLLPALIGHPLLFLESAPSEPVEVVRGDVEIIVEPTEKDISIRLNPPVPAVSVNVIRETPTRFKVVELSSEQRRLAAILAQGEIRAPAYAEDEVLAAISALSSAVTVHSAIGGGKGISRMEAEPTPHVHLTRAGE